MALHRRPSEQASTETNARDDHNLSQNESPLYPGPAKRSLLSSTPASHDTRASRDARTVKLCSQSGIEA